MIDKLELAFTNQKFIIEQLQIVPILPIPSQPYTNSMDVPDVNVPKQTHIPPTPNPKHK